MFEIKNKYSGKQDTFRKELEFTTSCKYRRQEESSLSVAYICNCTTHMLDLVFCQIFKFLEYSNSRSL